MEYKIYTAHLLLTLLIVLYVLGPALGRARRDTMLPEDWVGIPLAVTHGLMAFIMDSIL